MIRDGEQQAPEVWWRGTSSTKATVAGHWMSEPLTKKACEDCKQPVRERLPYGPRPLRLCRTCRMMRARVAKRLAAGDPRPAELPKPFHPPSPELYTLACQITAEMRQRYPRDYCFKCGRKLLRHERRACQFCITRDREGLDDLGPFRLRNDIDVERPASE